MPTARWSRCCCRAEPLPLIVLGKTAAHWLVTGLLLTVIAVLFGVAFDLGSPKTTRARRFAALGTPVLSLIGAVGAALTLGLRGGGVLTSLLVLPLYIPVLIFGAGAVGCGGRPASATRPISCCWAPSCCLRSS